MPLVQTTGPDLLYTENFQNTGLKTWTLNLNEQVTVRRRRRAFTDEVAAHTSRSHTREFRSTGVHTFSLPPAGNTSWDRIAFSISSYDFGIDAAVQNRIRDIALLRARSAIKNQNLNLAQTVLEYRQTCRLFSDVVSDVASTFRRLRSGRPVEAIRRALDPRSSGYDRALAERWLQYQYGIIPLLHDINGAAQALADALYGPTKRYLKFSSKEVYRSTRGDIEVAGRIGYYDGSRHLLKKGIDANFTCLVKGYYRVNLSEVPRTLASLGISNPAHLVYELTRLSFVVDWLFPVGEWLSSLDALNGVKDLHYYTVQKGRYTVGGRWNSGQYSSWDQEYYNRSGLSTNMEIPRLRYTPSTAVSRVNSGLALLRVMRK